MSKNMNVPKLRFSEFCGEWEEKILRDIGTFRNGLNKSKEDFGFGQPFVNLMDVFGKDVVFNENFDLVNANEKDLQLYNLLQGDILFIRSSVKREGVGETVLILDDLENTTYSGFLIRFREKNDVLNLLYKKYCFKTKNFRNNLLALSTTSANTNINQESLNTLEINIPSKPEQEKIASFLTSVDTKIEQLTKKEVLLQEYKKGVMNKIFNQKIRFKDDDGSEFPDWEEKKLKEIASFFSGGTPTSTNKNYYNGHIPFIGSGKINSDTVEQFITSEALASSSAKMVNVGDLLYALYGATSGQVAISKINGAINQAILCIRSKENLAFLYYWLLLEQDNIISTYLQGGQGNLSAQIIKNLKIKIPCLEEQTKIANFLSSIDKKIELTRKELNSTKEFKKALLQQMFV